jgi:hypothetical protein
MVTQVHCELVMKKTGTIQALNISPKGNYEGFLLRTGKKVVQINLAKEVRDGKSEFLTLGETVTIEVDREEPHGKPVHDVFRMVDQVEKEVHPARSHDDEVLDFRSKVMTLNYARHGEVNGGILNSGDFLHLKPAGAQALKLKVGMQVEGQGSIKPMVDGHYVIEAATVNGIKIHGSKGKKHSNH